MADEARFCEDEVPSEDESGVLFYVNKDGFPIGKKTWERMWRHVEKIHPKGAQMVHSVRSSQQLVKVIYYGKCFVFEVIRNKIERAPRRCAQAILLLIAFLVCRPLGHGMSQGLYTGCNNQSRSSKI